MTSNEAKPKPIVYLTCEPSGVGFAGFPDLAVCSELQVFRAQGIQNPSYRVWLDAHLPSGHPVAK